MPFSKTISATENAGRNHKIGSKNHKKTMDLNNSVIEARTSHVLQPFLENPITKNVKKNPTSKQWRQKAFVRNEEDQAMGESKEFFIHSPVENLIMVLNQETKGLEEGEEGCSTPKKNLTFDLLGRNDGKFQGKWVDANPFETLNEEVGASSFFKKTLEALEEG